jgi:(5-formylfuran-3-yl)methyl phosphate transaminase
MRSATTIDTRRFIQQVYQNCAMHSLTTIVGKYELHLSYHNVIIDCETSSLFRNLFQILVAPGDEVLLPLPYYPLYNFCAQLVNATIRYYSIDLDSFALDRDSFNKNLTDKTKLVVINTPGNPLGNVLTEDDLTAIDELVAGRAVIVNDEIYANTYFDEPSRSVLQLKDMQSTFITTNAFPRHTVCTPGASATASCPRSSRLR